MRGKTKLVFTSPANVAPRTSSHQLRAQPPLGGSKLNNNDMGVTQPNSRSLGVCWSVMARSMVVLFLRLFQRSARLFELHLHVQEHPDGRTYMLMLTCQYIFLCRPLILINN